VGVEQVHTLYMYTMHLINMVYGVRGVHVHGKCMSVVYVDADLGMVYQSLDQNTADLQTLRNL